MSSPLSPFTYDAKPATFSSPSSARVVKSLSSAHMRRACSGERAPPLVSGSSRHRRLRDVAVLPASAAHKGVQPHPYSLTHDCPCDRRYLCRADWTAAAGTRSRSGGRRGARSTMPRPRPQWLGREPGPQSCQGTPRCPRVPGCLPRRCKDVGMRELGELVDVEDPAWPVLLEQVSASLPAPSSAPLAPSPPVRGTRRPTTPRGPCSRARSAP